MYDTDGEEKFPTLSKLETVIITSCSEGVDQKHLSSSMMRISQLLEEYNWERVVNNWDELMLQECANCGDEAYKWSWVCPQMLNINEEQRSKGKPEKVFCTENCMIDWAHE